MNHRLKTVLIYSYITYAGYTNIFYTPKGIPTSDINCIRYAGYKNMPGMRKLYAILITGHKIYVAYGKHFPVNVLISVMFL